MDDFRIAALRQKLIDAQVDAIWIHAPVNRSYMSGFSGSVGEVVISATDQWLFVDGRYVVQAQEQCTPQWSIRAHQGDVWQAMRDVLSPHAVVGFEAEHVSVAAYEAWSAACVHGKSVPLYRTVETLREKKDDVELVCIRHAVAIADEALAYAIGRIAVGVRACDVAWDIEQCMRTLGASGTAFDTIVASGVRSALPHGIAGTQRIEAGSFVVIDCGARVAHYVSDVTRTVFVGAGATSEHRKMYDIVREAQERVIDALRPGMTGRDADAIARETMHRYGVASEFVHGTGHALGRDVHERPMLNARETLVLDVGHIVTVEPGLYRPGFGGVRIEDIVRITDDGCEVLTKAPKQWTVVGE
ncbi:MAG: Xaa-Pro peptidase family protein [Paenibacillaceae bacterium]|nr:Xaa-Pro peptidase family protein [Paenibacillaceae bacterium]